MPDLAGSFPARPFGVRPPGMGWLSDLWGVLIAVFIGFGCALIVVLPLPGLASDFGVRNTARPLDGATIDHGSCSTKIVLVSCDARLLLRRPGRPPVTREISYFFVDFHTGDYTAGVVADPSRPEMMTTDLALDKLWNRIITMAVAGPIFIALFVGVFWVAIGSIRRHIVTRRALSGQLLRPILLRLDAVGARGWTVSHPLPDGKPATRTWKVPRKARPVMMDASGRVILGVTAGDGTVAMPVDARLSWIRFSRDERKQLREALGLG